MFRFFVIFIFFLPAALVAQDSVTVTALHPQEIIKVDTVTQPLPVQSIPVISFDSCRRYIICKMLALNTQDKAVILMQHPKHTSNKDWLFYYILGLLLLFAALRLTYPRYFTDVFRFFFRTSLRVDQIREQLAQSGLQSLLYNLFFAFSLGAYVYLLITYYDRSLQVSAWMIPMATTACLLLLYLGKYLFFKFSGWLFGMQTATETYTFIVFLINKVTGIAILPFVIVIAFSKATIVSIFLPLSFVLVVGLFLYRFLRAYQPVQSEIRLSRLHFFIFFIAVEIAPLLIIYKLLMRYF